MDLRLEQEEEDWQEEKAIEEGTPNQLFLNLK